MHEQQSRGRNRPPLTQRRVRAVLSYGAAGALAAVSVLAVLVLWRPAPSGAVPGRFDFAQAVAVTELASAAVELPLYGRTSLSVSEQELADIASATLAAGRALPAPVAEAVRLKVPREIEGLEGLRIDRDGISICIRCRRLVSCYVTVDGRLARDADGGLEFYLSGAKIGLLRLPVGLVRRFFHLSDIRVLEPEDTGFRVDAYVQRPGCIDLELSREDA